MKRIAWVFNAWMLWGALFGYLIIISLTTILDAFHHSGPGYIWYEQPERCEKVSERNGTAACGVRVYVEAPASSSRRASTRGLINSRCGFGRRFTARGSTRSGRLPTR